MLLGDGDWDVGVRLLVRRLAGSLAGAFALDDADDLVVVGAKVKHLADARLRRQKATRTMFGQNHDVALLIDVALHDDTSR